MQTGAESPMDVSVRKEEERDKQSRRTFKQAKFPRRAYSRVVVEVGIPPSKTRGCCKSLTGKKIYHISVRRREERGKREGREKADEP